jgi:ABC-2 type transport system ATP-binding protein
MKDMIISLKKRGKTVVICSHLLADVQDVCDRIAILYQGEMTEQGRVDTLLQVTDETQLRTKGLPAEAQEEIRQIVAKYGGEVLSIENPRTTLEELFLDIVRERQDRPGLRSESSREMVKD